MRPALLMVAAYLIGAFPTSFVVGKLTRGIDLRQHGSGSLGATNAFRVLGWSAAIPVFIVDVMKGLLPTAFFPVWDEAAAPEWAIAYGAAAIIGHVFSIYVRFKLVPVPRRAGGRSSLARRRRARQAARAAARSPPTCSRTATTSARPGAARTRDVSTTMIYTHVLNRGPAAVRSPADRMSRT